MRSCVLPNDRYWSSSTNGEFIFPSIVHYIPLVIVHIYTRVDRILFEPLGTYTPSKIITFCGFLCMQTSDQKKKPPKKSSEAHNFSKQRSANISHAVFEILRLCIGSMLWASFCFDIAVSMQHFLSVSLYSFRSFCRKAEFMFLDPNYKIACIYRARAVFETFEDNWINILV